MKKLLGIVVLGLLWCNVGVADITVEFYLKAMTGENEKVKEIIRRNLIGINSGFMYANAELNALKKKKLYCLPKKLIVNKEMLVSFLNAEIESYQDKGMDINKIPIGMVLLESLKKLFPC